LGYAQGMTVEGDHIIQIFSAILQARTATALTPPRWEHGIVPLPLTIVEDAIELTKAAVSALRNEEF